MATRHSDPREAAALVHMARRWFHNAPQQLPRGAEDGFTHQVTVNRLLLGSDEEAIYTQPLR